ncbi:hypothetical protein ACI65C_005009 [Semiaphis heraclei]
MATNNMPFVQSVWPLAGGLSQQIHLSSLVLREFVSQTLGKDVCEVEAADICWYSNMLRRAGNHNGIRDTANCIIRILTGHNPKIQDVGDLMYKWILRVTPLTSILFGGRVIEIPFTALQPHHSHPYDLKRDNWRSRMNNTVFTPHLQTLNDIDKVFADYNYPVTPFSRVTLQPPRRREPIEDFLQYSPPRRVRPRLQEGDDVNERTVDVPNCEEDENIPNPCTSQQQQTPVDRSRPVRIRRRPNFYREEQTPITRELTADFQQYSPTRRVRPQDQQCDHVRNQTVDERPVEVQNCEEEDENVPNPCTSQQQQTPVDRSRPVRIRRRPNFYREEQTPITRELTADFQQYSPTRRVRPQDQQCDHVRNQTVDERPVEVPNCEEEDENVPNPCTSQQQQTPVDRSRPVRIRRRPNFYFEEYDL